MIKILKRMGLKNAIITVALTVFVIIAIIFLKEILKLNLWDILVAVSINLIYDKINEAIKLIKEKEIEIKIEEERKKEE